MANNVPNSFPDVMVDIETTGTSYHEHAILQVSATKFNLVEGTIGPSFDRCLCIPANRTWSDSTLGWWTRGKRANILYDILSKGENPELVIHDFVRWLQEDRRVEMHFWAKHTIFDYPFVDNYCKMFGYQLPAPYWLSRDIESFGLGHYLPEKLPKFKKADGVHNALVDVGLQLDWVMYVRAEIMKRRELVEQLRSLS